MANTSWEQLIEKLGSVEAAKKYMSTIGAEGGKKAPGSFVDKEQARLAGIASGKARRLKAKQKSGSGE